MNKRIIALLCAMVMLLSSAPATFANDSLYSEFKNASRSELRDLFAGSPPDVKSDRVEGHFTEFSFYDAENPDKYTYADKCMIILDAWNMGFNSFEQLDANVTAAAQKLDSAKGKAKDPAYKLGLTGKKTGSINADSISPLDPANVFRFDGKEFILLDSVKEDGETKYFVMAVDVYGTPDIDPERLGRWSDEYPASGKYLLPYRLTTRMAFGLESGSHISQKLPEKILSHIDMFHRWHVEPGSGAGYTAESVLIAPISILSLSEYYEYAKKIGKTETSQTFWTRTPVLQTSTAHFVINEKTLTIAGSSSYNAQKLRPVFYLKESFFKKAKLQECGRNVAVEIDKILSDSDVSSLYSASELEEVFGEGFSVTPEDVSGDAVVGKILTASYTYKDILPTPTVEITWERSFDEKESWESITDASGKNYRVQESDAGAFLRAVFTPTFDSRIYKNGVPTYAETATKVYTNEAVAEAVKEVDEAEGISELREVLERHYPLFNLPYEEDEFSDDAAEIFMNDSVNSTADVLLLYCSSIALDEFNKATSSDIQEKAESEYLLGSLEEYEKIEDEEAIKHSVITNLSNLTDEKTKVSAFLEKATELIVIERFNRAQRSNVVSLILEYYSVLDIDISGLSNYQYEIIGVYVVGKNYGTDFEKLKEAVSEGVEEARKTPRPQSPLEETTEVDRTNDGFTLPVLNKPEASDVVSVNLFNDLQDYPWSIIAINTLAKEGIISGVSEGIFAPDRYVTRNEFVKMIVNAFEIELTGDELSFEDVDNASWSAPYIKAAIAAGIISGISETKFGDGMNITREDVAVIAERVMSYSGVEMKSSSLSFDDSPEISDYAVNAVAKMKYAGIMNGLSGNMFSPKTATTRAQAAVVVYNLLNYYKKATKTDEGEIAMKTQLSKYSLVYKLGIVKTAYTEDSVITRGELAAVIAAFGNYPLVYGDSEFKDVDPKHKYAKEIEAVCKYNIMGPREEGKFMPDEIATYGELYDAILAASGYKEFPGGTFEVEKALSKEPVYAQRDESLTPGILEKVIFAALQIPLFEAITVDEYRISENVLMNKNFDTFKASGRVNAVSGVSLGGRQELEEDKLIITVDSKDYLYFSDGDDFSEFLGYNVNYYYRKSDDSYQVLYMEETEAGTEVLRLSFEQITDASNDLSSISYERGRKVKTVALSKKADFVYNGRRCYDITKADLTPSNGYITLIDTNNDKSYDVVNIENYEYIMVAQSDASGLSVLDRFTWDTYSFVEDEDAKKISITKNGRYIKFDYLMPGDILAIAKSRDNELMKVYVSDRKVSGRVNGMSAPDYEITVDNNILYTVKDFDFDSISLSKSITVGIDWNGYAVGYYVDLSNSGYQYGFVYGVHQGSGLSGNVTVGILTQNNVHAEFGCNKKIKLNGEDASKSDLVAALSTRQLVAYVLDSEGLIQKIHTAQAPAGDFVEQTEPLVMNKAYGSDGPSVIYSNFGMTLEFQYNLPGKAVMFEIVTNNGEYDEESSRVTNVSAQVIGSLGSSSGLSVYNADTSRVSLLCTYEHESKGGNEGYSDSFSSQAFVVGSVRKGYSESANDYVAQFKGYHAGNEVNYTLAKKLADTVDASKIKAGDVLIVQTSGNEIISFRRFFTLSLDNKFGGVGAIGRPARTESDWMCNYGDYEYTGESIPSSEKISGYDYDNNLAQHTLERTYGTNKSSLSGTRWASLYGDIKLVYKAEGYSQPVATFKIAGSSEYISFGIDSNTKVYVYNKTEKTLKLLENSSLNISNAKAAVAVRYGNIKDLVVYED